MDVTPFLTVCRCMCLQLLVACESFHGGVFGGQSAKSLKEIFGDNDTYCSENFLQENVESGKSIMKKLHECTQNQFLMYISLLLDGANMSFGNFVQFLGLRNSSVSEGTA